jgi:hypothetical protein
MGKRDVKPSVSVSDSADEVIVQSVWDTTSNAAVTHQGDLVFMPIGRNTSGMDLLSMFADGRTAEFKTHGQAKIMMENFDEEARQFMPTYTYQFEFTLGGGVFRVVRYLQRGTFGATFLCRHVPDNSAEKSTHSPLGRSVSVKFMKRPKRRLARSVGIPTVKSTS